MQDIIKKNKIEPFCSFDNLASKLTISCLGLSIDLSFTIILSICMKFPSNNIE